MDTKKLLGVVHLDALPSAARFGGSFDAVLEHAMADARALRDGGVDGVIVENFGDAPFRRGDRDDPVRPDVVAGLAVVARSVRVELGVPVGVNCLRNDAVAALGVASCTGASWVRVNVLAGTYVTDQGRIDGEAARVAEYRKLCGANVELLADLLVKHATPLGEVDPVTSARDLAERAGADGVIVSGSRTGEPVDAAFLDLVRGAIPDTPVWIGSGLDLDNAADLWPRCTGAIVGTAFKENGRISEARVAAIRAACPA